MAGGIQSNVPDLIVYGPNKLTKCPGFETTDFSAWTLGTGWSVDTVDFHGGARSVKFVNTGTKGTLTRPGSAANTPPIPDFDGRFLWCMRAWMKKDAAWDGQFTISGFLHNAAAINWTTESNVTIPITASHLTTSWALVQFQTLVGFSPHHVGEASVFELMRLTPTGGSLGGFSIDDVEIKKIGLPYQVWVPSRYWGYVWEDDPQDVTVEIDLDAEGFVEALADLEIVLTLKSTDGNTTYWTQTLGSLVDGNQTTSIDFNAIPMVETILHNVIRKKSDQTTAILTDDDSSEASFPTWKLIHERVSVRNGFTCYVDYRTRAFVLDGRKRFPMGWYSYWASDFMQSTIPSTSAQNYRDLRGPRKPGETLGRRAFEYWRSIGYNLWHDYVSQTPANPNVGSDQITAPITAMKEQGIYYSQMMREHYVGRYDPYGGMGWRNTAVDATAVAGSGTLTISYFFGYGSRLGTFSTPQTGFEEGRTAIKITSGPLSGERIDVARILSSTQVLFNADQPQPPRTTEPAVDVTFQILDNKACWDLMAVRFSQKGFFGWYWADEPAYTEGLVARSQYRHIRDASTKGGVCWGVHALSAPGMMNPLWRYTSDVLGTDPYPGAISSADELHYQSTSTGMHCTTLSWTQNEASRRMSHGKMPYITVPQAFNWGANGIPLWKDTVHMLISALIAGAKGAAFWQWGLAGGLLTWQGPFWSTRADTKVTLDDVATAYSGDLSQGTGVNTFEIGIDVLALGSTGTGGNIGFAQGFVFGGTKFCHVASWTPDANGDLTLVPETVNTLNYSTGKINIWTGAWTHQFTAPLTVVPGTVDNTAFTPTTTQFEADDITTPGFNFYQSRYVHWNTGALAGTEYAVTSYSLTGGRGHFTVTTMPQAPANDDTFEVRYPIGVEFFRCSSRWLEDHVLTTRAFLRYEDYWTAEHDDSLVSNFSTAGTLVKWAAIPSPQTPGEVGILVANLLRTETPSFTVTLASAVAGGVVEVVFRGSSKADQSNISLTSGDTVFTDNLAAAEAVFYIVRKSASRVRRPTNGIITNAALAAL